MGVTKHDNLVKLAGETWLPRSIPAQWISAEDGMRRSAQK